MKEQRQSLVPSYYHRARLLWGHWHCATAMRGQEFPLTPLRLQIASQKLQYLRPRICPGERVRRGSAAEAVIPASHGVAQMANSGRPVRREGEMAGAGVAVVLPRGRGVGGGGAAGRDLCKFGRWPHLIVPAGG